MSLNSETWETGAGWWASRFASGDDPEYALQIVPLVKERLGGARRVLDAGCGEGQLARAVGRQAVGVDSAAAMCAVAQNRKTVVARAAVDALPFANETFDGVVMCLVLEHVAGIEAVVTEIARVLTSSGRLLLFLNHPFMQTPGSGWIEDHILEESYWRVGPYLREATVEEEVEPGVNVTFAHRPLSRYVNAFASSSMFIEEMIEPSPPEQYIASSGESEGAVDIPRMLMLQFVKR